MAVESDRQVDGTALGLAVIHYLKAACIPCAILARHLGADDVAELRAAFIESAGEVFDACSELQRGNE